MTKVDSINVHVQTANVEDAGTDGAVLLGFCGREFVLDTTANDFERGSVRDYTFGTNSNVRNAASNDPRKQILQTEDADRFPVYLRFVQKSGGAWKLQRASVMVNGQPFPQWDTSSMVPSNEGIWLGDVCGHVVHLPKNDFK